MGKGNYTVVTAYMQPELVKRLEKIKKSVHTNYGVNASKSDLIRYAVERFVRNAEERGGLEEYVKERGWL